MKKNKLAENILVGAIVFGAILAYYLFLRQSPILLIGLVGFIVLAILLFLRPIYGLMAILVIRPMVDIFGDYTVNIADRYFLNLAAVLSLLVIVWGLWVLIRYRVKIWNKELFWPILFFGGISIASFFYSYSPAETVTEMLRIGSFLLLYFVARTLITDLNSFRRIGLAFAASLAVPTLLGFYQVLTGTGLTFAESTNRAYGTFGHPNVLAFYLVLAISFLTMYMLSYPVKIRGRWVFIGILCLLLILTFTRGGWAGLIISLCLIGLIRFRRILWGGIMALLVVVAILPTVNVITTSVFGLDMGNIPGAKEIIARQADRSSYQWRLDLWSDMKSRFYERPLQGFGLGSFPALQQLTTNDIYAGVGAHNDYLRLLVEVGVIGLGSYIILLGAIFYYLWQTYQQIKTHPLYLTVLGILGFSAAFVVMSFFDNLLQSTPVMWAFMIMLGAIMNLNIKKIIQGK